MTPLLKTYLEWIKGEPRKLDARGVLQMHRQVNMAVDDIYMTLSASIKRERTGGMPFPLGVMGSLWPGGAEEPMIWLPQSAAGGETTEEGGLDIEALYAPNRHWVILGDPGSGKTTLLRHQAWKAADDHLDHQFARDPGPLFRTADDMMGRWVRLYFEQP